MIFNKIDFFQYRCFMDGSFEFVSSEDFNKNITLVEAPNGSGKTELLFAFWWVLYGEDFDFNSLQNKEASPYALNSEVYRKIKLGEDIDDNYCTVTLEFEYDDVNYILSRTERYTLNLKTKKIEKSPHQMKLSEITKNGETTLPIENLKEVNKRLEKIIPKKLLHGIIFDGERMQKISSTNEKSIEGIEAVISDITSRDLIIQSIEEMDSLYRKFNSDIKGMAKDKDKKLFQFQNDLENTTKDYEDTERRLKLIEQQKKSDIKRLEEISGLLRAYEETKIYEREYTTLKEKLILLENQYSSEFDDLFGELSKNSSLLLATKLFDDVNELVSTMDIPQGLNVEAVESILNKGECICGTDITESIKKILNDLKFKLPPDNVNSLILEIIRQKNININGITQRLNSIWSNMSSSDQEIKDTIEEVKRLSSKIGTTNTTSEELIKERESINTRQKKNFSEIDRLIEEKLKLSKELKLNTSQRDKYLERMKIYEVSNQKLKFAKKCIDALNLIQKKYVERALSQINNNLQSAYKLLSEDADLGRNVYITQFTLPKYKIITYLENDILNFREKINNDIISKYDIENEMITEEVMKEIAILENALPNSTGQSKAVSIAFVKAILDYSMQAKENKEEFEVTKKYPVVIDAPFGDLSGKNLVLPASNLNKFSEQVILMLSPQSYKSVEEYMKDKIGRKYKLTKTEGQSVSQINK